MGLCFGRRDNEKDVKGGRLKDGERETEVGREKGERRRKAVLGS